MQQKYREQAQALDKANFRLYGIGNFDVSEEEVARVLELLATDPSKLPSYYEELEQLRMG